MDCFNRQVTLYNGLFQIKKIPVRMQSPSFTFICRLLVIVWLLPTSKMSLFFIVPSNAFGGYKLQYSLETITRINI